VFRSHGGVEGGSCVELSEVGHELDRRFTLVAGEREETAEKILIRETRRESEDVRIHGPYVSR
jgi:hypothetical protein